MIKKMFIVILFVALFFIVVGGIIKCDIAIEKKITSCTPKYSVGEKVIVTGYETHVLRVSCDSEECRYIVRTIGLERSGWINEFELEKIR